VLVGRRAPRRGRNGPFESPSVALFSYAFFSLSTLHACRTPYIPATLEAVSCGIINDMHLHTRPPRAADASLPAYPPHLPVIWSVLVSWSWWVGGWGLPYIYKPQAAGRPICRFHSHAWSSSSLLLCRSVSAAATSLDFPHLALLAMRTRPGAEQAPRVRVAWRGHDARGGVHGQATRGGGAGGHSGGLPTGFGR